jgi:hypothetical protein
LGVGGLWLAFAFIFGALAIYHLRQSTLVTPEFHIVARPGAASGQVLIFGMDVDAPLNDFSDQFNLYLQAQNSNSRGQNLAACAGYVMALLTALFSAALEFRPQIEKSTDSVEHSGAGIAGDQIGQRIDVEPQRTEPPEER